MTDWVDALGPLVIFGAAGAGTIAGAVTASRRRARHGRLHDAQEALQRVGFTVVRVEQDVESRDAWDTPGHITLSLRGSLGERTTMSLGWGGEAAEGALRVIGLALVRRVTFTIGREDAVSRLARKAGISDIEVGDARLDDALKLRGWPTDTVRGVIATPAVRAALSMLFAHEGVNHVRLAPVADGLGATAQGGALTLSWRLAWARVGALRAIADDVLTLAAALDDARWAEPRPEPTGDTSGSAGPQSGAPFGVPGLSDP